MADSYDVIVIGGGPGGYHAAIRAAQLGKNTAVVEIDKPGGRCLNYACIPAKTMLHTAELLDHAQNSAELGVKVTKATLDWKALGERRAKVSETLSGGVKMLWDKNKVTMIEGKGALDADANVVVDGTTYEAGAVVLATGSVALPIPGVEFSRPRRRHLGRLVAADAAEVDRGRRRRRLGRRDRLRLHPLRDRGDADRDASADPPGRGQGHRPRGRAGVQEAGDQDPHRQPDHRRRGRRQVGEGEGRRRGDRGRVPGDRRRPRTRHRGAGAGRRRGQGRQTIAGSRSTTTSGPRIRRCTRSAT